MEKTKQLFGLGFLTVSLIALSSLLLTSHATPKRMATLAAVSDTIRSHPKYQDNLTALTADLKEEGFDIENMLTDPRFEIYEGINDRFEGSAEKTSLDLKAYKAILGIEYKVAKIDDFMAAHFEQLQKAEETYGISKFIIAAILGVESNFGNNIGSHNPFNAYTSMIVLDYRVDFARAQLLELLEFTERENIDVLELKSSYAGAMSYAQFIPYSVNKWWVGDELFNMENNIMSIGNYLAYFEERTGDIETAVLRYNPSSLYVGAVLHLAKEAEENFRPSSND